MRSLRSRLALLAGLVLLAGLLAGCQTATLLADGRVLLIAGERAWIVDPIAGTRTPIDPPAEIRVAHSATLLPDGTVLLAGGATDEALLGSAELLRTDGVFVPTGALVTPRSLHTATLLADGTVLLAGGGQVSAEQNAPPLADAEIYDPASGTFRATGSLVVPRALHSATLLPDGSVIVIGGGSGDAVIDAVERYDPATGMFAAAGVLPEGRGVHTATLLPDGRILVAGGLRAKGSGDDVENVPAASTFLYDPATGTSVSGPRLGAPRAGHTATLLPDGRVLITGGVDADSEGRASAEILDPVAGTVTETDALPKPLAFHAAVALPDGGVLITGIIQDADAASVVVIARYDPATGLFTRLDG